MYFLPFLPFLSVLTFSSKKVVATMISDDDNDDKKNYKNKDLAVVSVLLEARLSALRHEA